jgi:hypothetical protein
MQNFEQHPDRAYTCIKEYMYMPCPPPRVLYGYVTHFKVLADPFDTWTGIESSGAECEG